MDFPLGIREPLLWDEFYDRSHGVRWSLLSELVPPVNSGKLQRDSPWYCVALLCNAPNRFKLARFQSRSVVLPSRLRSNHTRRVYIELESRALDIWTISHPIDHGAISSV